MQLKPKTLLRPVSLRLALKAHAPGRINLIGEHTDYNGGKVLPFAMPLGIDIHIFVSDEKTTAGNTIYEVSSEQEVDTLELAAGELQRMIAPLTFDSPAADLRSQLPHAVARSWARYAVGALAWHEKLRQEHVKSEGAPAFIRVTLSSNLPSGAGVSSSAALCTGLLASLAQLAGMDMPRLDIAKQAMMIEHQFAGTRCGLMDQTAVALATEDHLLLIDFKDLAAKGALHTRTVKPHPLFNAYRPVLINSKVKHELGSSPYNQRRQSCEEGLVQLCKLSGRDYSCLGYFANDKDFLNEFAPDRQQATLIAQLEKFAFPGDYLKARRLGHAILETVRVDQAVAALERGDREVLSQLINASHESLQRDYEVSCDELDLIREQALDTAARLTGQHALLEPGILGSRMTGGGFGGSIIQLVHEKILDEFCKVMEDPMSPYTQKTLLRPDVVVAKFSAGLKISTPDQ